MHDDVQIEKPFGLHDLHDKYSSAVWVNSLHSVSALPHQRGIWLPYAKQIQLSSKKKKKKIKVHSFYNSIDKIW